MRRFVMCGGFSAPIRDEARADILLVVFDEYVSIYAANNIARGIRNLSRHASSTRCRFEIVPLPLTIV